MNKNELVMNTRWMSALAFVGAGTSALADGYPPYFGFSGYYGQPAPYYTRDSDVHQATRYEGGSSAFGVRTYTAGGPFWGYKANTHQAVAPRHRKARYVRVRG